MSIYLASCVACGPRVLAMELAPVPVTMDVMAPTEPLSTLSIHVPEDSIGRVIGAKGAGLQKLRVETGVQVQVPRESAGSGMRSVEVTGTPAQCNAAQASIQKLLESTPPPLSEAGSKRKAPEPLLRAAVYDGGIAAYDGGPDGPMGERARARIAYGMAGPPMGLPAPWGQHGGMGGGMMPPQMSQQLGEQIQQHAQQLAHHQQHHAIQQMTHHTLQQMPQHGALMSHLPQHPMVGPPLGGPEVFAVAKVRSGVTQADADGAPLHAPSGACGRRLAPAAAPYPRAGRVAWSPSLALPEWHLDGLIDWID